MNTPVPPDRGARAPRPTEHNLDKHARDAIGGALRPGDPRRFVVEAMLGAVQADGVVDPRELAVLDRHLGEHELFQGVRAEMARTMIDLAADALRFAGSSTARIGAIARGLPSRIHRGAAYAMACEVVAADDDVSPAELTFLEHLRLALRVSPEEALGVQAALRGRRLGRHLDEQVAHVRSLAPLALELAGLRAVVEGVPPPARSTRRSRAAASSRASSSSWARRCRGSRARSPPRSIAGGWSSTRSRWSPCRGAGAAATSCSWPSTRSAWPTPTSTSPRPTRSSSRRPRARAEPGPTRPPARRRAAPGAPTPRRAPARAASRAGRTSRAGSRDRSRCHRAGAARHR